jgi:hypothetical protein
MIPLLVPIGLGLVGGYLSQDSTQKYAGGGGVLSDKIYAPKGYTFVVAGSHRSRQKVDRYKVEYISLYKIGGSQGTSGTSTLFMSNNDYEKIKNIIGVTKKEYLKSDFNWFSRKENDKINKVFQNISQTYAGGGGVSNKSAWAKNGFREYPYDSPQEWKLVEWSSNGHSPNIGKGQMYFQKGTGFMFIEKENGDIYKPKSSNKLFWREPK